MSDQFPLLRASLAPTYASLDSAQLDGLVRAVYGPGASAEDVEGFFDDMGRGLRQAASAVGHFAQQAAPVITHALPAMASGAMAGSALGPWGALAGAVAGGAGDILSHSKNPTARAVGGGIGTASNLVGMIRGGGVGGGLGALSSVAGGQAGGGMNLSALLAGGGGGGSANGLFGMLARPEILNALSASALGSFGRQSIPVGGQQIPVHMMLSALSTLAGRAAHESAEYDESAGETPTVIGSASEALGLDVDDAEGRTDTLLTLLALSPSIWAGQQRPPVTVNVSPPDPPSRLTEDVWVAEADEDVEDWEAADEGWDESNWDESSWDEQEESYAQ